MEKPRKYTIHKTKAGKYRVSQSSHLNDYDWDHSVQTGPHPTKDAATAWIKKHSSKSKHTIDFKESVEPMKTYFQLREELNELSKKTLKSYVKRAEDDFEGEADNFYRDNRNKGALKAAQKRSTGLWRAKRLMNKEEAEEIDEISQTKLDAYRQAAHRDKKQRDKGRQLAFNKSTGRAKINPPESRAYNSSAKIYKEKN